MKNLNLKNAQRLSREAQKQISGGDKVLQCNLSGCFRDYLSDGTGRCLIPPCSSPNFGSESQDANGRWQCCY